MATQTTAQVIFKRKFICQIQRIHTLTKIDTQIFGVSSSGDKEIDRTMLNDWMHTQMTIADMTEYHSKGINFIIDPTESVVIYETIKQHLESYLEYVKNNINLNTVPVEDLTKMENFAVSVFPMASRYKKPAELRMNVTLQDMLSRGQKAIKPIIEPTVVEQKALKEKHNPIANLIAKEFHERNRR